MRDARRARERGGGGARAAAGAMSPRSGTATTRCRIVETRAELEAFLSTTTTTMDDVVVAATPDDAARWVTRVRRRKGGATALCASQGTAKRVREALGRGGGGGDATRLDVLTRDRAAIARLATCDLMVVDVEDERGVDGTARACALGLRARGVRLVVARSPAMAAMVAGAAGEMTVEEFMKSMATPDETPEPSASELWGNAWANVFAERGDGCRFHNYAERGCEKDKAGETCAHGHAACMYCEGDSHRAFTCETLIEHARAARVIASSALRAAATKTKSLGELHRERIRSRASASGAASKRRPYLYVMGGRNRGLTVGVVERYDVLENKWERAPTLVEPRGSHGACAVGSTLYVVSGGGCKSNLTSMETLDTSSDGEASWTMHDNVVKPRHAMGSAATRDGKVYTVGGWFNGSEALGQCDVYDCDTKMWSKRAELNYARRLHGVCATDDGCVFVFGGTVFTGCDSSTAERYDPVEDKWTEIARLPFPACATACAVGSDCFVFTWGTQAKERRSGGFYRYDPKADIYEPLGTLPLAQWFGFAVCAHQNVIYVIGGIVDGRWTGRSFAYHISEHAWEEIAPMAYPRRRTAAAVVEI